MASKQNGASRLPLFDGLPAGAAQDDGRVIVIGAGAAGLTAARVLQDHGREVLILEGRDRIGGRLNTIDFAGATVDEGGNWVHGVPQNPMYQLLQDADFELEEDEILHPFKVKIFDKTTGRWIHILRALYLFPRISRVFSRFGHEGLTAEHDEASLAERLENEINGVRNPLNKRLLRYFLRTVIDLTYAERSELLNTNALAINPEYENTSDYVIPAGYSSMVERLAIGLDIRLGTIVSRISYSERGVEVFTDQGTYEGSHVVVTVPLGVLKAQKIAFEPPLPAQKVTAIENLGFGNVEKIFLRFEEPFWRNSPNKPMTINYVSDTVGDFPAFTDITKKAGLPVLCAFLSGEQALSLKQDAEPMIDQALQILKDLFPDKYQEPIAVRTSNWQNDPFAYGSYSTPSVTTRAVDYDELAQPVDGRLLFAGEATYRPRAGYVEGAAASGLREARRILGEAVELKFPAKAPEAIS